MSLSTIAIIFLVVDVFLLFLLPRRWAPLALLVGACYMTLGQGVEVGPFQFPIIRLLLVAGIIRVIIRREWLTGKMNGMDFLMLFWSIWAATSSIFHKNPTDALIFRLGFIYNACGIYFLLRIFCQSIEDIIGLCRLTAIILFPVAVMMLFEKIAQYNLFSLMGGVSEIPEIRLGKVRAAGPFAHSILAGSVGAVCLPLLIGIWKPHKKISLIGISSCLLMIISCASSGPIVSAMAGIVALLAWRYRQHMRFFLWCAVFGYIALDIVMKAPAYYLMGRIDLVGGSGGWHRAAVIESAFAHLNEWWLGGTDYTRHWMPTGVSWSEDHTDITNHYLHMGVAGGLPLMVLFIAILSKGFSFVGQMLREAKDMKRDSQFMIWALGASLFAHAVTFLSVSIFDQSIIFLYTTLALIGSAWSVEISYNNLNEKLNNNMYKLREQ